jgi:hypothetical protein
LTLDEIFGYEKVEKINLEAGNWRLLFRKSQQLAQIFDSPEKYSVLLCKWCQA